MTTLEDDRWERADRLLQLALDLPLDERAQFLLRECAEDVALRTLVERLIDGAESDDDARLRPAGGLRATAVDSFGGDDDEEDDLSGRIVDRYRLVREIGRGGMAVVYLAEREAGDFEQQVALKLIKRGVDTDDVIRRFEQERRILARIRHPHIARFIDGGTTDEGRPFFAMELVEGRPLDRYCDELGLSVRERLGLFCTVADAVGHAHRNLVVHRDIKPSNILVGDDGQVKLLDFGIASLLEPDAADPNLTRTRQRLLTPAFASPEQIRGEPVTTASDVYQLGVLLYLLLAGRSPHRPAEDGRERVARAIVEETPAPPSVAVATGAGGGRRTVIDKRALRGDLDNIVMMALRKEPDRRYASAGFLVDDIRRHLDDLPVSARPDTLAYRTSKFLQRHRVAVAFSTVLLASLIGFAATMTYQAGRVARERDRANREAVAAERVSEFLVDLFKVTDPGRAKGETITAREVLDAGAERLSPDLAEQPAVRARLMDTIGRVYQNLGLYDEADGLLEEALAVRRDLPGVTDDDVLESLAHVAWLREERGDYDAAEPLYREALELAQERFGNEHEHVAGAMNNLALLLYRKDDLDAAEELHREALAMRRRLLAPDDPDLADSLNNLSLVLGRKDDHEGAERLNLEALSIRRAAHGVTQPTVAVSLDNLGRTKFAIGDREAAEEYFIQALEMRRKLFGDAHPEVAESLNNLASLRFGEGDLAGAEAMFRQVVAVDRDMLGSDHPDYALSVNNLAIVLSRQGKHAEALPLYEESLAVYEAALDRTNWLVGMSRGNLGECLLRLGRVEAAEPLLRSAHAVLRDALGEDHRRTKTVAALLDEIRLTGDVSQTGVSGTP